MHKKTALVFPNTYYWPDSFFYLVEDPKGKSEVN